MSGKPATASVAASRAGASRVLVYVAEPGQLEAGAGAAGAPEPPPAASARPPDALFLHDHSHPHPHHSPAAAAALPLHRNAVYRTHLEQNDIRHQSNTIFYKPLNDSDCKVNSFGSSDGAVVQRTELLPINQQFLKEPCIKVEDIKVNDHNSDKRDSVNHMSVDFGSGESFRIPESGEISTYQTRCPPNLGVDNMQSMQSVTIRQDHNHFNSCTLQSGDINCDRELSVGKSFVNYQFLEQSVSHQSIVNQSISILNQQVGVSRVTETEGGAQLVRTADGVVLAVLPPPTQTQATVSTDAAELSRTVSTDTPQTITVPLGWRRIVNGNSVLYISPSGTALSALPQLREYLQTAGTCKCGLPCPLRPETTFSFDPKVVSKQYQPASGAELTKLCNHKRKLLASLQARAHSPATPPPLHTTEQKKAPGTEAGVLKKKMKKRQGFPANMGVSQMMVQRDRPLNDFKAQEEFNRTISPGVAVRPNGGQACMATFPTQQLSNANMQDPEVKQETHVQKSSHYLTVNSGWITQQQENIEAIQKSSQQTPVPNSMNVSIPGLSVLGSNGQIIGVNTGFNKQTGYKNTVNVMSHNIVEQMPKDDKKDLVVQQNMQLNRHPGKDEENQIFCGLNQALTPEVMQKINEQQQIFIQQNQKQIEMAMKGFRSQLADNVNVNQNKPQNQNQYVPQGQLVIQNGAVVKTNPAKTPPWQVKRNENTNTITSPSPKPQKIDGMEYEESNTSVSEDSSGSYSPFPNNEQAMCSRVPPLPQHYNMMGQQWPGVDVNKKKVKVAKGGRKKASPIENKVMTFGNNGMRILQETKTNSCENMPNNNVPSFMDDPSGYLAQQTVLLNNTINRQVGINSAYDNNQYENSLNCYVAQNQGEKSCKPISNKNCDIQNIYRNNMVPNASPSPNHTPDSSVISDKNGESSVSQCCKGCNVSMRGNQEFSDNQMRLKYMKSNVYKLELDGNNTCSPRHGFDDSPVTSSTFIDRSPMANDSCGPIQAGTVSTSNVSPTDSLQLPEHSPTLSNSSRSTDTPQSSGNISLVQQNNCTFPMPSPAYSYPGSSRENFSNPSTPGSGQSYTYNSPGQSNGHSISGTQMMHFISNHNVNKNLMEVDNISMVGVKPVMKSPQDMFTPDSRRRIENSMPGYCPPPHLGGGPAHSLIQACYVQTFVTTMASGFSVTRDTVTSVLAGKANTMTTSINAAQANFIRRPPPPSVNMATTYAIPNNQPDPFINSVNLPTSYPLHIAGTAAQNMISKSPLEMMQNVMGTVPSKTEQNNTQATTISITGKRTGMTPGQILISSTGQIIVSNNTMPPPPPKMSTSMSMQNSGSITNVTTSVVPAVGGVQPIVNQSTVVVNTLQAPFVIQPPMMAVDGQVVQQNTVLPQIVTGMVQNQSNENHRQIELKNGPNYVQGVAMVSPESLKKRNSKKKKNHTTNITNVLQITAPQPNPNNIMLHSSPQHNTSPQFSPRGFQLSPNNNISPTPMLQALTIVPGKSGAPAHIVMNGQGGAGNFGSQQIITNTSPSQQINLLQPVNLINNGSGVVPNFQTFQQFIVPNLGGMVMTADGTAIIQDGAAGMPVQLQLQTVNGQNVLTPVQGGGVFPPGSGVVLRPGQPGKMLPQAQHSPGAQFLQPAGQVMMSSPSFTGQLSPLLASLSPTGVTFNAPAVRAAAGPTQEYLPNALGQALMVPLSPKQQPPRNTFVHQNTTIVQQQTTLVAGAPPAPSPAPRLGIDPNAVMLAKPVIRPRFEVPDPEERDDKPRPFAGGGQPGDDAKDGEGYAKLMSEFGLAAGHRHSVSTQTLQQRGKSPARLAAGAGSPPDTTTHSPLGALEPAASPGPRPPQAPAAPHAAHAQHGAHAAHAAHAAHPARTARAAHRAHPAPRAAQAGLADTTTKSPEPSDHASSAMVQCVSSSEQDMAEAREIAWRAPRNDFGTDNDTQNMIPSMAMLRQNRTQNSMESNDMHYNQNMGAAAVGQHVMPVSSNYYERPHTYKRKNDFGDGSTYRTDKIMRTNNGMVHGMPKDAEYDPMGNGLQDKQQTRRYSTSGTSSDASAMQKVFDRHNLGSGDDAKGQEERSERSERSERPLAAGDLVWGPVKGYPSWPGKVGARAADGRWLVHWFGDKAPALVPRARLLTLTEGLEAHHAARTKHRKSRKLNTLLENAIQEAMAELDKKSEKTSERAAEDAATAPADAPITETPKRTKKQDKARKEKQDKKNTLFASKSSDARLRSSR